MSHEEDTRFSAVHQDGVVLLAGDLDLSVEVELDAALRRALTEAGGGALIIDMGAVTFCDSTALRVMTTVWRANERRPLIIRRARPTVRRLLSITGFDEIFELED